MQITKATWHQGLNGDLRCDYRGLSIRIKVKTGRPSHIEWYVAGKLDESSPVLSSCSIEIAQETALEIVDRLLPETPHWQAAERKELQTALLRR